MNDILELPLWLSGVLNSRSKYFILLITMDGVSQEYSKFIQYIINWFTYNSRSVTMSSLFRDWSTLNIRPFLTSMIYFLCLRETPIVWSTSVCSVICLYLLLTPTTRKYIPSVPLVKLFHCKLVSVHISLGRSFRPTVPRVSGWRLTLPESPSYPRPLHRPRSGRTRTPSTISYIHDCTTDRVSLIRVLFIIDK